MNSSGFFCRAVVIEVFLRVIIYILCPGNNEKSCGGGGMCCCFVALGYRKQRCSAELIIRNSAILSHYITH